MECLHNYLLLLFSLVTFLQVVFLHPVHNFALVAYDPSALGPVGSSEVRAAELLPGKPVCFGFPYLCQFPQALNFILSI